MLDGGPGIRLWGFLRLSFARLDTVFSHSEGSINSVEFEVETAGIADRLAFVVAPPEGRRPGTAVRAAESKPAGRGLEFRDLPHCSKAPVYYSDRRRI